MTAQAEHKTQVPKHDVHATILALSASIEWLEQLPQILQRPDLLKYMRRRRGAWKLYRDGAFSEAPPPINRPLIVPCTPCPQIEYPERYEPCPTIPTRTIDSTTSRPNEAEASAAAATNQNAAPVNATPI